MLSDDTTISERLERFCARVGERIDSIDSRVKALKARIDNGRSISHLNLCRAVRKVGAVRAVHRDDAEAARANMKARLMARKEETDDRIAQWKLNRELERLEKRAADAEDFAAWATIVAIDALDELDLAVMEAIEARMDADAVAQRNDGS